MSVLQYVHVLFSTQIACEAFIVYTTEPTTLCTQLNPNKMLVVKFSCKKNSTALGQNMRVV